MDRSSPKSPVKTRDPLCKLRNTAESRLARTPVIPVALTPDETRRTLHELRVHQIELEMQNEELRRTQAELAAARRRYFDLYNLAPIGYLTLSESGLILEANLSAATLLGVTSRALVNQPLSRFIRREDQDPYYLWRKRLFAATTPQALELRLASKDGSPLWVLLAATLADGHDSDAAGRVMLTDITGRKRAEDNLLNLNEQLESRVLERTAELHQSVQALEAEITQRQRLECAILELSEREQCSIGQDLHEGLGQELAGIAMLGDVHARQLQAESHPQSAAAAKIATYIRTTIDGTRRLATDLYPIELERCGLLPALGDLAAETSHRCGVRCELQQSGEAPILEKSAEIHLFRIVQEGIANAVKHGGAQHIRIESLVRDGMQCFAVTDDGIGFDPASAHSGMGLHLMHYRARVIGAQIVIERPAQGGCRVSCRLPLAKPPL